MAEEVANLSNPLPEKSYKTKFISETSASLPTISIFDSNLPILLHNQRKIDTTAIHKRLHFSCLYYIL